MSVSFGLAVIVVNYRTPYHAVDCIRSLVPEKGRVEGLEVILIDNASSDGSPDIMKEELAGLIEEGFVKLMPLNLNGGFGWANNQAMLMLMERAVPPELIMLLNPDCTIEQGAIKVLQDEMIANKSCAVVGSQLLNPDSSWTGSAFRFPTIGRELVRGAEIAALGRVLGIAPIVIESEQSCEVEWVTGASCLLRTSALLEQGLFDDGFFLYFEEVELMFRLRRAGWSVRHAPLSRVCHIGGASTGLREGKSVSMRGFPLYWFESRRRFFTLAYGPLQAWLSGMAWVAGAALGGILALIRPSRAAPSALADLRQMRAHGLRALAKDRQHAIVRAGDPQGRPPRWMSIPPQNSHAR